ncbi:MAG TPA: hypothetical protein VF574_00650 [Allosphingosinicella sp.]
MRAILPVTAALALCLAGCGAPSQSNRAGGEPAVDGNASASAASAAGGEPAASANSAAATPVGPCPFATRGWVAEIVPASEPGGKPAVALNGEARPDKDGRMPMMFALGVRRPPVLVLELSSDAAVEPQADRGWMTVGTVFEEHEPQYTHAAVRCADVEIARVPIRPAR